MSKFSLFFKGLLPELQDEKCKNLNILTRDEKPQKTFYAAKHKPGRDFFNGTLLMLMLLFLYVIIFYDSFT